LSLPGFLPSWVPERVFFARSNHRMVSTSGARHTPCRAAASLAGRKTTRRTARDVAGSSYHCRVTHPFHPRFGEELECFEYRRDFGEQRVYFYDESGCLTSMPAEWTSAVAPDALRVLGAGRALFRVDDLVRLVEVLDWIRGLDGGGR